MTFDTRPHDLSNQKWHEPQGFIQDFLLGVGNLFRKANIFVRGCGGILARVKIMIAHVMLGGSGGVFPQENFLNLDPLRILVHFQVNTCILLTL